MIERGTLTSIIKRAEQGRTAPMLSVIESKDGTEHEVFVKLSAGCDQGVVNLAREAFAACLAEDLNLPVAKPWLVEIPSEFNQTTPPPEIADNLRGSVSVAFGSTRVSGYDDWRAHQRLSPSMVSTAAAILLFDAIIQNPDRRVGNPNCMTGGENLCIFDHELAFAHLLILLWKPPWTNGGMNTLDDPGPRHIFVDEIRGVDVDWEEIKFRWADLSDARLDDYMNSIPREWDAARSDLDGAKSLVAEARDRIEDCVNEAKRILT